jgi:hypothetical protein
MVNEPHVRQALLDLDGRWRRPHYQAVHIACHLMLPANGQHAEVLL